jgi:prepilin signal peptidase PulO-like enzyme (type II secretory pathway)
LVLFDLLRSPSSILWDVSAAGIAFCVFFIIRFITKGLGFGDLKYAALIAFFAGLPYWFAAMMVASVAATLFFFVAIVILKKERKMMIPFAPFLTIGALVAVAVKFATVY